MHRIPRWLCLAVAASLLLTGCDQKSSQGQKKEGQLRIAVIPKGLSHDFWKFVEAGAREAASEHGNVKIEWMGPPKEDETRNQIELVQNFVISNVDGIVLAPLSDQALKAPVRTARKAGIPVVIMDSPLQGEVGKDFVSYVGTDNYDAGALAGERMAEITGGKGRVLLLRYAESSASTQQREQGFLDALKKHAPEVEVVDPPQYAGADANTAKRAAQNMITAAIGNLGGFDAAFCPNESSSKGMLLALNDRKLTSEVRFIGFDACPPLIQAVKQGEMDSFVAQNPRRMGYLAVKSMIDHIQGKQVEESIDTGAILVTAENIDDPEVQKLITPPDQK